ncbi:polysaccharide pyruvyl transferase family protein [Mycetocola tolaasinivorans]|nr:polysaccharide pyruvyl transferase family protein [Mycetocola tolaasinivorans]
MHFARTGDTIWGTGINDKIDAAHLAFEDLDVRAVRGPRTRERLQERGIFVPEVYGDPALLLPELMPQLREWANKKQFPETIIPNLNDFPAYKGESNVFSPVAPLKDVLKRIAQSEFVTGSSLHGIVIAESLGIPARLISSAHEPEFKYQDYFLGSGRESQDFAASIDEARAMGGHPSLAWDPAPLRDAFPSDLWN